MSIQGIQNFNPYRNCFDPRKWEIPFGIFSTEELGRYVGKVVKFTTDKGATFHYVYIDTVSLHPKTAKNDALVSSVACYPEKRVWNGKPIEAKVVFTDDFFKASFKQTHFEEADFSEFADREFCGPQSKFFQEHASKKEHDDCIVPLPTPICRAPLTVVRSEKQTQLKISILFNNRFSPQHPTEPAPSQIVKNGASQTHTWKLSTGDDDTLTLDLNKKIKMIWWEAKRNEGKPVSLDPQKTVCIPRNELKSYLAEVLQKQGVREKELSAFVSYWDQALDRDIPYVRMQQVDSELLKEYLPEMQIDSQEHFSLKRFYFLFDLSQEMDGLNKESYLEQISNSELSKNAVIDLGGETLNPSDVRMTNAENQQFIQNHIYAGPSSKTRVSPLRHFQTSGLLGISQLLQFEMLRRRFC